MNNNNKIITFIDHIGRTMIGEYIEDVNNGKSFTVKNPAIIHVQPTPQGQLNVQTIPLYFREFVSEKNRTEGTVWKFHYDTVVVGENIDNDPRLIEQYERLFTGPVMGGMPANQQATAPQERVVKLFDE